MKKPSPGLSRLQTDVQDATMHLLREESKRRNKSTRARWPLGPIVDEAVWRMLGSKANSSSGAAGENADDSVRRFRHQLA